MLTTLERWCAVRSTLLGRVQDAPKVRGCTLTVMGLWLQSLLSLAAIAAVCSAMFRVEG